MSTDMSQAGSDGVTAAPVPPAAGDYMLVCHPDDQLLMQLRTAGTGVAVYASPWVPRGSVVRALIKLPEFEALPETVEEWRAYFAKEHGVASLLFEYYLALGHTPREAARLVLERLRGVALQKTEPEATT